METIRQFVEEGGGLLLTYQTGTLDEKGSRRGSMPLADLIGVQPFDLMIRPSHGSGPELSETPKKFVYRAATHHPIMDGLEDRTLTFSGGVVECGLGDTTREIASVVDFDYGRMHWHHTVLGWYPSERIAPLITVNEPAGRVVYLAGGLDAAVVTQGDPATYDILARSVRWAGDAPLPIEVNAPPTVEVVSYLCRSTKSLLVSAEP